MLQGTPDPKELGRYLTLGQVGMEMVAPVGLGLAADYYLGWTPWGVIVGAIFGLVMGVAHLVVLSSQANNGPPRRRREAP